MPSAEPGAYYVSNHAALAGTYHRGAGPSPFSREDTQTQQGPFVWLPMGQTRVHIGFLVLTWGLWSEAEFSSITMLAPSL